MLARLAALERMIVEQEERVLHIGLAGWDVSIAAERLRLFNESYALYRSALKHLLGDDFSPDPEAPPDGDAPAAES